MMKHNHCTCTTVCPLHECARQALDALKALGAHPHGYCFCYESRDPLRAIHTGECVEARLAIRQSEGK